jgi:phosphoribosyl-ATP pyrophosphohydrolase
MKTFEGLWSELSEKIEIGDPNSRTVAALSLGTHALAKKVLEEAGEVLLAAESQGRDDLALEISQLLYWLQVLMIDKGLALEDIYRRL